MRRAAWLGALMVLTGAFALAQTCTVRGAYGGGAAGAPDSDQPNAFFSLGVAKFGCGDRAWQWGWFSLTTRQDNQLVSVVMFRLEELTVDTAAHTASFSGQAVLTVRTRTGFERVRGTVQVSVADNRSRDGSGDPDTLGVAFFDQDGNEVFSYSGEVKRGDIAVFEFSRGR